MGRKRIPGLRERAGIWHIEKQIFGRKIHESTGTGELKTAELVLARRIEEARMATMFGVRAKRTFREAATRFLEENLALRSIGDYAMHLKQLDPVIGHLGLEQVHLGTEDLLFDMPDPGPLTQPWDSFASHNLYSSWMRGGTPVAGFILLHPGV